MFRVQVRGNPEAARFPNNTGKNAMRDGGFQEGRIEEVGCRPPGGNVRYSALEPAARRATGYHALADAIARWSIDYLA